MASRAADFFFSEQFFWARMKKKVPSRPFFTHPAATPETYFLGAWPKCDVINQYMQAYNCRYALYLQTALGSKGLIKLGGAHASLIGLKLA